MTIINEILWTNMSYYFPEVNAQDLEGSTCTVPLCVALCCFSFCRLMPACVCEARFSV